MDLDWANLYLGRAGQMAVMVEFVEPYVLVLTFQDMSTIGVNGFRSAIEFEM